MFQHQAVSIHRHSAPNAAPLGVPAAVAGAKASPLGEGGWHESSWELCQGLEISDLEGELPQEFRDTVASQL